MGPSFMDVMPFARLPDSDDDDDDDKKMKNIKRKIVYYLINIECFKPVYWLLFFDGKDPWF